jgi:hypothetical protein
MIPDRSCNLVQLTAFAYSIPYFVPWLAAHSTTSTFFLKESNCVLSPEELHERTSVAFGIRFSSSDYVETWLPQRGVCYHDTPPGMKIGSGRVCVSRAYNQRGSVEHLVVGLRLLFETPETIPVRLDFVPMQRAVYDCHIGAHRTTTEA